MRRMRPEEIVRTALAVPIVIVLGSGTGCGGGEDAGTEADDQPEPVPVRTTSVAAVEWSAPLRTSGVVESRSEMNLSFKVPGYVADVLVSEGDRVSADQVLARLRSDEVDAEVRAAAARAERAARNLERTERLFADSVFTESRLEEAREAHERAQASLEAARFNQTSATIRAPVDGRILRRMAEPAEFVGAGVPVLRIGDSAGGWIVRVAVSDRHVSRLSVGDSAAVEVPGLDGRRRSGRVNEIADASDPRTGTFDVEIRLDDDDPRLRSGMIARVTLVPSEARQVSLVPSQAVVDGEGMDAAVFVVEGDSVRLEPVQVVRIGADSVGIHAPHLDGATLVTDGAAYLRNGERVEDRTAELPSLRN